jgi:death-on-curing protein
MNEPVWITRATILALQEQLLSTFGGVPGLRDETALKTALTRPEERYTTGESSTFGLAATYGLGLMKQRPFAAGNKRLGFTAAIAFLELNGYRFRAAEADAALRTLAAAAGAMDEDDYAVWLEANARKV